MEGWLIRPNQLVGWLLLSTTARVLGCLVGCPEEVLLGGDDEGRFEILSPRRR
jgi:hypothetical protein